MPDPSSTPRDHESGGPGGAGPEIDTGVAHGARVYDYLLGGTDNFPVDRDAAEALGATLPGGIESARTNARLNRVFLGQAVRHLCARGVRQFLDVGAGIPTVDSTHLVAHQVDPEARVVYVDNDPIVRAHAHRLLDAGIEAGSRRVSYVVEDMRRPDEVLARAADALDFGRPVGLMLVASLHMLPEQDDPAGIAQRYIAGLPSGSYLVLSHLTEDFLPDEMAAAMESLRENLREQMVARPRDQVAGFLDGLELVAPGLVPIDDWVGPGNVPAPPDPRWRNPLHVAVGRKP